MDIIIQKLVFVRYERLLKVCSIALVGKYTKLSDCYASVFKALEHSALAINHKLDLMVRISGFCFQEYFGIYITNCHHVKQLLFR